jgi:hypothetical protein
MKKILRSYTDETGNGHYDVHCFRRPAVMTVTHFSYPLFLEQPVVFITHSSGYQNPFLAPSLKYKNISHKTHNFTFKQGVLGRTNSLTFPKKSPLFEAFEPNLMQLNFIELTLTSFNLEPADKTS